MHGRATQPSHLFYRLERLEISLQIDHRHHTLKARDLLAFAEQARSATKLRGTVTILISSNEKLRALNRAFRKKDKATDVLSFPGAAPKVSGHAGDIAISAEIAIDNAKRYGHSPADEVKILILHGMLHLAGHDHEEDNGKMARLENRLRKHLGLPASLIDRTQKPQTAKKKYAGKSRAIRISRQALAPHK
jgi:probable rRNA maturation factor